MKPSNIWTYSMYKAVLDKYPFQGVKLAKELNVTKIALTEKADRLGVSNVSRFTSEERELLSVYGRSLGKASMFLMPDHTATEIERELCALRRRP